MLVTLAKTDFGSLSENLPRLKLSNMYVVENPLSVSGFSYISRPSLNVLATLPGGNIRGVFSQQGNGKTTVYVISGENLYILNNDGTYTLVGIIPGSDFCTFSSTIYYIAISADGALYLYDGTTLTNVVIPDGQKVSDVTSLDNYLIVGAANTNKFYWIEPGALVIAPLNFTSAERNPDDIISMISIGDELWAIGQKTVEIFTDSGDANAPFLRLPGRAYQTGCVDKHSLVRCNKDSIPCLVWVSPTKEVIMSQGIPTKISNESIEELLRASETFTAWTFRTNRHEFYVLTTDNETVVFDLNLGNWYRWSSYSKTTWDAYSGVQVDDKIYVVTKTGSDVSLLSNAASDGGTDFIICEIGGFIPNPTNTATSCNSLTLFLNYGISNTYLSGPTVELRFSDDAGNSWSPYFQGFLGVRGAYDTTVRYRSLGSVPRPGRYIELRFSELTTIRLDGVTMNDTV